MRFKKGSKVEVLKSEVPFGAWRCAEILSGNGHNYTVGYAHYSGKANETAVERVSRKEFRPSPPVCGVTSWMVGDVVEVFDDFSWKTATVLEFLGGECYSVRLLGFSREFQTHKKNIRVRQSWLDDNWVVIGKVSGCSEIVKSNRVSTSNFPKKINTPSMQAGDNTTDFQESHVVSARTLKRAFPFVSSSAEACTGNIQKRRTIEKYGECPQVISGNPSSLFKKGHCWRHASLASKGLMMCWGSRPFPWYYKWGIISIQCSPNETIDGNHCTGFIIFFSLMIKFITGVLALLGVSIPEVKAES